MMHNYLMSIGIKNETLQYPFRGTDIGRLLDKYLKKEIEIDDRSVHLLFSANRWETVDSIKAKLQSGTSLIVDRYAFSNVAYTSAKTGIDFEWCKRSDIGIPKPDIVFFMDSNKTQLDQRDSFGDERYEIIYFQNLVYNNYKRILSNLKESVFLDATEPIEIIHTKATDYVLNLINSKKFSMEIESLCF